MPLQAFATEAPFVPRERRPRHDVELVSGLTGLSPATVRRRCADGTFPHSRFGGAIRFSDVDVEVILADARARTR